MSIEALYEARPIGNTGVWRAYLPVSPVEEAGEIGRRIVRHGLRDWLEKMGEDVGPRPEDPVRKAIVFSPSGMTLYEAAQMFTRVDDEEPSPSTLAMRVEERVGLAVFPLTSPEPWYDLLP